MAQHRTGTREEWLAERLDLLVAEKELTRRGDEIAQRRQSLPWVKLDKEYHFETDAGSRTLAELFDGRSQLLVYHFMFGPEYTAGCPSCSAIADGFDGSVVHLINHGVSFYAVSRGPLAKLQAYKQRMGWTFPWASSFGSDFNFDFHVSHTNEEWQAGAVQYNFRETDFRVAETSPVANEFASRTGTDFATYRREGPGVSAFVLDDGIVYHTYSAYERGIDALWGMYDARPGNTTGSDKSDTDRRRARRRCLPFDVLAAGSSRSGREFDLPARRGFAAPVAAEVRADVASTAGVKGEAGRAAGGRVVAVAPFHEHDQGRRELASLVGEDVHRPSGPLRVRNAFEKLLVAQPLEPVGEDVGRNPEVRLELVKPREADQGVPEDQQRPALPDDLQRSSDRADLVWIVALEHAPIVADLLDKSGSHCVL